MTLPTTLNPGDTGHLAAHNEIHDLLPDGVLPTGLIGGNLAHRSHHERLHRVIPGLSPDLSSATAEDHIDAHEIIHTWSNAQSPVGPRGTVGPHAGIVAPGGFVSVSPGAGTIQAAIAANGNNTIFKCLNGAYPLSSRCQPKPGQRFYFENGATITGGGTLDFGFYDAGSLDNVEIHNGTFSGFTDSAILNSNSVGWEIANNDASGGIVPIWHYSGAWVHHNNCHDSSDGPVEGFQSVGALVEDNIFGPNVGGGNGQKWAGTTDIIVRHNRSFDNGRTGIWMDYANYGFIVEWNLVEDCGDMGMWIESNGLTQPECPGPFVNTIRFNHVRNCNKDGILIAGSTDTDVYGNSVQNNQQVAGPPECELGCYISSEHEAQGSDLARNSIHDNQITTAFTQDTGRAAAQLRMDAGILPADTVPFTTNTKANNWDYNTYDITDVDTSEHFHWYPTNHTFNSWRSIQDPHSTAT